jgi:NTP pyrophosphatase (non-canonical NTP hydrolase)
MYSDDYTFYEYQKQSALTARYPNILSNLQYPALGLAGEVGEVCNKIKKIYRDQDGNITGGNRIDLKAELGDVLWYIAALCRELNLDMHDVALSNIDKLMGRLERGTIKGNGDAR